MRATVLISPAERPRPHKSGRGSNHRGGRPVHDYSDAKTNLTSDRGNKKSRKGAAMAQENIIGRVMGALVIGALIGFERTFHGRPAGFRTHSLVCIASAILKIATVYQNQWMTFVEH